MDTGNDQAKVVRLSEDLNRSLLRNIFKNPTQTLLRYHLVWSQIKPDNEDVICLEKETIELLQQEKYEEAFEFQKSKTPALKFFNENMVEYYPNSEITGEGPFEVNLHVHIMNLKASVTNVIFRI